MQGLNEILAPFMLLDAIPEDGVGGEGGSGGGGSAGGGSEMMESGPDQSRPQPLSTLAMSRTVLSSSVSSGGLMAMMDQEDEEEEEEGGGGGSGTLSQPARMRQSSVDPNLVNGLRPRKPSGLHFCLFRAFISRLLPTMFSDTSIAPLQVIGGLLAVYCRRSHRFTFERTAATRLAAA